MLGVVVLATLALLHFLGVIDDADFLMKTKKKKTQNSDVNAYRYVWKKRSQVVRFSPQFSKFLPIASSPYQSRRFRAETCVAPLQLLIGLLRHSAC